MSRSFVFALSVSLCLSGSTSAALDPELTTPYKVQVVLRFTGHRLMTPPFRDQLVRELRSGLQAALGPMGTAEVFDFDKVPPGERPPLWREVEAKGLPEKPETPGWAASDVKTHFLVIDYVDGQYEVKARQYDGLTGLASKGLRRERTPDRPFVARTAALLIDRDFGLVGTVVEAPDPGRVKVAFKGGGLGVPLDRWAAKDDVFAVVRVGAGSQTSEVFYTILRAETAPGEDGTCLCRVFQPGERRLTEDGATLGYRCVRLGTTRGPLRVQVVRARIDPRKNEPRTPPPNVIVQARRAGFAEEAGARVESTTDAEGFFTSERIKDGLFDHVAFVNILTAGQLLARVPVPIVDDRTVVLPIPFGDPANTKVIIRRGLWERRLYDVLLGHVELFKRLNAPLTPESRAGVLADARKAAEATGKSLSDFEDELKELEDDIARSRLKNVDLSAGRARLDDARKNHEALKAFVASLEDVIRKENDPRLQEARTKLEQAKLLEERESDYDKALKLYEEALAVTGDAALKARVARLKQAWEPKGEAHKRAREFIYGTWAGEESAAVMEARVAEARKAFKECEKANDPFGPRRLLKTALAHTGRLGKQLEGLRPDVNEDDEKPAKKLADVLEGLKDLIKEVSAFVAKTPVP